MGPSENYRTRRSRFSDISVWASVRARGCRSVRCRNRFSCASHMVNGRSGGCRCSIAQRGTQIECWVGGGWRRGGWEDERTSTMEKQMGLVRARIWTRMPFVCIFVCENAGEIDCVDGRTFRTFAYCRSVYTYRDMGFGCTESGYIVTTMSQNRAFDSLQYSTVLSIYSRRRNEPAKHWSRSSSCSRQRQTRQHQ